MGSGAEIEDLERTIRPACRPFDSETGHIAHTIGGNLRPATGLPFSSTTAPAK